VNLPGTDDCPLTLVPDGTGGPTPAPAAAAASDPYATLEPPVVAAAPSEGADDAFATRCSVLHLAAAPPAVLSGWRRKQRSGSALAGAAAPEAPDPSGVFALLDRFDETWEKGAAPALEACLPPADDPHHAEALEALVYLDLEHRIRANQPARVEAYLRRYPGLGQDRGRLVALIAWEWELRRRHEGGVTAEEYPRRFPHLGAELLPRLTGWSAVATPTRPSAQAVIPGYELLAELGRGGMGVVYKARHTALGRVVALKMILAGGHAGRDQLARFRTEAEAIARLQHPNIVQVYEVGENEKRPYFSLEFCAGGSLDKKMAGNPLPPAQAAKLAEALARAMEAAHQAHVIHRDLKPANVLLTADGTPKITDFGLAKKMDEAGQTHTGDVMGTPSYMAPEQAEGKKEVGPAADVYALGAILYDMLTGRPPFKAATTYDTILQVVSDEPVPPRRLNPKVPADLETVCLKCLQKEPAKRYGSAQQLADDLERWRQDKPILARPVRLPERAAKWLRRHPTAAALVAVLAAVGLALPVAGVQFSRQLAQRRAVEQRRLEEARAEVHDLLSAGQAAARSQDWGQADGLLDKALQKVEADPALAELAGEVGSARGPVKLRMRALGVLRRFRGDRDEALFHATLASGDTAQLSRATARARAGAALRAVGLRPEGRAPLALGSGFNAQEKEEIVAGCYALLLMLAEIEARRLPGDPPQEYRRRLDGALSLLDRAAGLGVRTRAVHLQRARYLGLLGEGAAAAREADRVRELERAPNSDPQDHFLVGHELYSQGKLGPATQEFHRALQLDAKHFWAHYFLGICCVTAGKPETAVAHLTICQGQQPGLLWIYLLRGFALGQVEDFAGAERDFDRALGLSPGPSTLYVLYNNRGVMRVGRKETRAQGVEDLRRAAALRPGQYQAYASLAEAYRLDGRPDEARRQLDAALAAARRQERAGEVRPATLALLYYSRARLHLQAAPPDRDAAVADLVEAARMAGANPALRARAEADRGRVLHLQKRLDEALAAYAAALAANPAHVEALRWEGEVLLALGRYGEAAGAFERYGQRGGKPSVAVYRQRGLALARTGRHAEAANDYGRALNVAGGTTAAQAAALHLYRAQEYLTLNELRPALRDFQEVLRLEPGRADALLGSALVQVKLGDVRGAVANAERAVAARPAEPRLWLAAARVFAQAGARLAEQSPGAPLRSRCQARAVVLVGEALVRVSPRERPAFWRDHVLKDAALSPVRPDLPALAVRFGLAGR
jgi:tetratricopeptide (TPR) repeat protein